jgi:hypothetical protein
MLQVVVSSVVDCVLRRSPTETLRVDIVNEMVVVFQKQEEQRSHLKKSSVRVCDLILGPPSVRSNWPTG